MVASRLRGLRGEFQLQELLPPSASGWTRWSVETSCCWWVRTHLPLHASPQHPGNSAAISVSCTPGPEKGWLHAGEAPVGCPTLAQLSLPPPLSTFTQPLLQGHRSSVLLGQLLRQLRLRDAVAVPGLLARRGSRCEVGALVCHIPVIQHTLECPTGLPGLTK